MIIHTTARNDAETLGLICDRETTIQVYAYVPMEAVVEKPEYVVPMHTARVYLPQLWVLPGGIQVNYSVLCQRPDFNGIAHYNQLHIYEVWENLGDDGHTDYRLSSYLWHPGKLINEEVRQVEYLAYDLEEKS